MKPTQTGIAVALALAVVLFFFVFGGFTLFGDTTSTGATTSEITTQQSIATTTMPIDETTPVTKLMMKDEIVGTGAVAAAGDSVTVQYVGSLTDGTVFDASRNRGDAGFTFTLGVGQVIQGWDQGVAGMKEGGKRQLIIPAALAYGDRAVGDVIKANSTLVFEVELVKVQKTAR